MQPGGQGDDRSVSLMLLNRRFEDAPASSIKR